MTNNLVPSPAVEMVRHANVPALLARIRPEWQAKSLIIRVRNLLDVDPSSACQRLLNAAIHDLRGKIIIAGIDIATEAASQNKLPPIIKNENIDEYPTAKLIDLAYYMGLLSRSEWRRVCRCYEIRRDLEHEDDEYEAGIEDCVYIFNTCIEAILAKDPVQLVKVTDVKRMVEQATAVIPDDTLMEDYGRAPQPRQEEILKFLISKALNKEIPDVVQQNSYTLLSYFRSLSLPAVLVNIGSHIQSHAGRNIDTRIARVANAVGAFAYLRQSARKTFFEDIYNNMNKIGTYWDRHEYHGELLRSFLEYGGLQFCPDEIRPKILKWLVVTYIGVPGGQTRYGNVRHVFYSNSAAPLIKQIIDESKSVIHVDFLALNKDKEIKRALTDEHISRRFESLVDIVET